MLLNIQKIEKYIVDSEAYRTATDGKKLQIFSEFEKIKNDYGIALRDFFLRHGIKTNYDR